MRVFGTIFVSTTRIHGVHLISERSTRRRPSFPRPSWPSRDRSSCSCSACADRRVRRTPVPEILDLADEVRHGQPRTAARFPAVPCRSAGGTSRSRASSSRADRTVRDDIRHRRMVAGEPVDDVLAVADVDQRIRRAAAVRRVAAWSARPDPRSGRRFRLGGVWGTALSVAAAGVSNPYAHSGS